MKGDCELLLPRHFAVRFRRDCLHLDESPLNLMHSCCHDGRLSADAFSTVALSMAYGNFKLCVPLQKTACALPTLATSSPKLSVVLFHQKYAYLCQRYFNTV